MRRHDIKKTQRKFNKIVREIRNCLDGDFKNEDGSPRFEIRQISREVMSYGFIYQLIFIDRKTGESEIVRDNFFLSEDDSFLGNIFANRILVKLNTFVSKCIDNSGF